MSVTRTQPLPSFRLAVLVAVLAIPLSGSIAAVAAGGRPVPAKVSVSPTSIAAGAVTTFAFKYQANVALNAVDVALTIPAGWTPPVTSPATAAGYVSVQKGNCTIPAPAIGVSGSGPWTLTVHGVTCAFSKTFTLAYAKATSGTVGTATFTSVVDAVAIVPATVKVVAGPATKLVFVRPPAGATVGTAFGTQPQVAITDAAGNVVTGNTSKVTLSITSGTGTAGSALTCTTNPLAAVAGVATFAGCRISKAGTGYRLHATDGALTATDSAAFPVAAGAAAKLAFSQQPAGPVNAGQALPTQPVVTVQDAAGNTVTTDTSSVTLGITPGTGTSGAALGCTSNTVTAVAGVATFTGCTVGLAGTGYRLRATDGALTAADSTTFDVVNGAATHLGFVQQPGGVPTGGIAFPTQPKVTVLDAGGTTVVTDTSNITLTLTPLTGTAGASFSCTADTLSAVAGVATFSGCAIDKAGSSYTLTATDGALAPAVSDPFSVNVGPGARVVFTQQPGGPVTGGVPFPGQPVVAYQDAGGNVVTTGTMVVLSIVPGTGTAGAQTYCTPSYVHADEGYAAFSGCRIDKAGTGYRLRAASNNPAITTDESAPFDVAVGPATGLTFVTQPGGDATTDGPFPDQPAVAVVDAGGNVLAGATPDVTLAITDGTGNGGTLTCDANPVTAVAGVATFSGCAIDKAVVSNYYGLHATAASYDPVDSAPFDVRAGAAATLAFTSQPGGTDADADGPLPDQPVVTLYDIHGNVATGDTSNVMLSVTPDAGPFGAVLSCDTNPVAAVGGVATFSGCALDLAWWEYKLRATSGFLPPADSDGFAVDSGVATALEFYQSPGGAPDLCAGPFPDEGCFFQLLGFIPPPGITGGASFYTVPVVAVRDVHGNLVDDDTSSVTLEIKASTGTAGASLSCPANPVSVVNGFANFASETFGPSSCSIDLAGEGYVLHATDGALTPADSNPFDVTVGPVAHIALTLSPDTVEAGTVDVPMAQITVTDLGGNNIPGQAGEIYLRSTGDATFGDVTENLDHTYSASIDADVAGTQDITAEISFGTPPCPPFFPFCPPESTSDTQTLTLTPGAPYAVVFTVVPTAEVGHLSYSDPITVQIQDAYGNPTNYATGTTLTLAADPFGGFLDADGNANIDELVVGAGQTEGTFRYVSGGDAGEVTISVGGTFTTTPATAGLTVGN